MSGRIFRDKSKLLPSYVPPRLPHREPQIQQLMKFFMPVLSGELPGTQVIISGNPGTGKTAVAKRIKEMLTESAKRKGVKFRTIYVNCRLERTPGNIIRNFISNIVFSVPLRGLSIEEMFFAGLKQCADAGEKVFWILDDSDLLFSSHKDFIYKISRVSEADFRFNLLSLLIIVHSPHVIYHLDPWSSGALRRNIVHFEDYNYEQLIDILEYRVSEAFYPEVVLKESIETCADMASQYGFNVRYALELLLRAGEIAEGRESSIVIPEYIRMARKEVPPSFSLNELKSLSLHEKLILLAISRLLMGSYKAYTTMGELEKEYTSICDEIGVKPVKHTYIWKIVSLLSQLGFISKRISGKGIKGKTSLIGIISAPAESLNQFLEKEIRNA
ncbi:hypothetical protein DRN86_00375 [Candidatus Geothermarchaeota archaeon]|nr:MAG: hypothetical protein DRN86_00375 [Candidatus Geothermarchaeota archaeon]